MKICVLIKQVPDKDSPLSLSDDNLSISESNITWVANESDSYALEEALQIKEKQGGEVVVCTLGRETAQQIMKDALAKGADRGILLSENCKLNTKPELKIYADDVKCSHGSTVGALDKNQLFYLQSRGLSKKVAENFLIRAFYKDVLPIINDKESIIRIDELVNKWLSN